MRRLTIGASATALLLGGLAALGHDDQGGLSRRVVRSERLRESVDGKAARVTLLELEYAPGASTGPHRHPGPVLVYVLEGAIESQLEGGPPRTYKKGESFFEPANALHAVSRNASPDRPARFLAYFLTADDAKDLVLPAH